jgi:hypothetical protein
MSDNKILSGSLAKLVIFSFSKKDFSFNPADIRSFFIAPINPESFTKSFKNEYEAQKPCGNNGQELKFKSAAPQELKLDFILDGTGTMEGYVAKYLNIPVFAQLRIFLNTVYNYYGDIHRPRFLLIFWGSEIKFKCVLSKLDINYTLFDAIGTPMRAKITATFLESISPEENLASAKKNSPDLTHYQKANQGDRLDLMTNRIYNDPKYLMQVAKVNTLTSIRTLKPGMELYFPPFNKKEA